MKVIAGAATLVAVLAAACSLQTSLQTTTGYKLTLVDKLGNKQIVGTLPAGTFAPRISPDGKLVAYDSSDSTGVHVFLYSLANKTSRKLTDGDANYPMWSADSQWVLYTTAAQGEPTILRQRADGTGQPERLTAPARAPESWSTPNDLFSFITLSASDYDIWAYSFRDRRASVLYRIPNSAQHSSSISPDGRWVAYMSDENGREDVWVQSLPPTTVKVLVTKTQRGSRPLWAPDGKELYFDDQERIFSVTVTATEKTFEVSEAKRLPITGFVQGPLRRQYDLTSDGKQFLMLFE